MSDSIYTEQFVSLTDEQREQLDGKDDTDIKVEEHKTLLWQEPDADDVEMSEESVKDDKKDTGTIKVLEHDENAQPIGIKKEMKRPPMSETEVEELEEEEEYLEEAEVSETMPIKPCRPAVTVPEPAVKRRASITVSFDGVFGKVRAKYLDVYTEGVYLILVEDEEADFSYSPPDSDESFRVGVRNKEYEVLSPGISFGMKNQRVRTTVLLIINGEKT